MIIDWLKKLFHINLVVKNKSVETKIENSSIKNSSVNVNNSTDFIAREISKLHKQKHKKLKKVHSCKNCQFEKQKILNLLNERYASIEKENQEIWLSNGGLLLPQIWDELFSRKDKYGYSMNGYGEAIRQVKEENCLATCVKHRHLATEMRDLDIQINKLAQLKKVN